MRLSKAAVSMLTLVSFMAVPLGAQEGTSTAKVGSEAPDFELTDASGKSYRLSDFRGKNPVVLEFFRSGDW